MPLTKTIDLPRGMGQHFFFDIGNGDSLAFFWFPDSPESQPGVTHPANLVGRGPITTANATMNHVAFDVSPDKIDEYRERLAKAGIEVTPVINHDASENQASLKITPSTFVRSIYFLDPDGIQLEFAAWTRELNDDDVNCEPHSAAAR
jgi:catechol 2,3-dioxygenase-like lactoylglutathione lyase family enzyme